MGSSICLPELLPRVLSYRERFLFVKTKGNTKDLNRLLDGAPFCVL